MLWHRGDPAGWNRHESLGIRFKSSVAGEIEDLLELLLMTYPIVTKSTVVRPPLINLRPGTAPGFQRNIYVIVRNDKKQMTFNTSSIRDATNHYKLNRLQINKPSFQTLSLIHI